MRFSRCDGAFIAQMEHLLWLYEQPYDATEPVVCFDERPCFLIGDRVEPLALQCGKIRKEHYAYEKHGSCALLAAIEPLTGQRVGQVYPQRTQREYALFCQTLAARYPQARTIHLVQDNLNTHHISAFYQHLPADEAFTLAQRFTFHQTPKSASWLSKALDRGTRHCVAWVAGGRNADTFRRLYVKVQHLSACRFSTGDWDAFAAILARRPTSDR